MTGFYKKLMAEVGSWIGKILDEIDRDKDAILPWFLIESTTTKHHTPTLNRVAADRGPFGDPVPELESGIALRVAPCRQTILAHHMGQ